MEKEFKYCEECGEVLGYVDDDICWDCLYGFEDLELED